MVRMRSSVLSLVVYSCLALGCVSDGLVCAGDALSKKQGERIKTIVLESQRSREMVRAGVFKAEINRSAIEAKADGPSVITNVFCAWNRESGDLRFDYDKVTTNATAKFISTPKECWFTTSSRSVGGYPKGWLPTEFVYPPFDIRTAGMASVGAFQKRRDLEQVFADWLDPAQWHAIKEDGQIVTITIRRKLRNAISEDVAVFDLEHGFTILERRWRALSLSPSEEVISSNSVQTLWKEFGSVWVPTSQQFKTLSGKYREKSELTFDWLSVNGPVEKKYFTRADLGLSEDASVIDHTPDEQTELREAK